MFTWGYLEKIDFYIEKSYFEADFFHNMVSINEKNDFKINLKKEQHWSFCVITRIKRYNCPLFFDTKLFEKSSVPKVSPVGLKFCQILRKNRFKIYHNSKSNWEIDQNFCTFVMSIAKNIGKTRFQKFWRTFGKIDPRPFGPLWFFGKKFFSQITSKMLPLDSP